MIDVESTATEADAKDDQESSATAAPTASARSRRPRAPVRLGRLTVVDLAGSERLSMSGAWRDDARMAETQSINLSLTVLGEPAAGHDGPCPRQASLGA